jgi:hypothetical protein
MSEPTKKKMLGWQDAAGALGLGLLSYGAWLAYRPAGFVVPGLFLLWLSIVSAASRASEP